MRSWIDLIVEALKPPTFSNKVYVWQCTGDYYARLISHDEEQTPIAEITKLIGEPVKFRWFLYTSKINQTPNTLARYKHATGLCETMDEAKRVVEDELGLFMCRDD